MDDWDLLFLQAAGKGKKSTANTSTTTTTTSTTSTTSSNLKRSSHTREAPTNAPATVSVNEVAVCKNKKMKLNQRGNASKSLQLAGFQFSDTEEYKSKNLFAARYRIADQWEAKGSVTTPVQSIIRAMFVIVRNCRAVGFASFKTSKTPLRHSYRRKKNTVRKWLLEMKGLAKKCSEVILTRQYIEDCLNAFNVIAEGSEESDDDEEHSAEHTKDQQKERHKKHQKNQKNQNQLCNMNCLELISCLDLIYGELLVAALDAGTSLPDPRVYLESLAGCVENCEKNGKRVNIKGSNSSSSSSSSSSSGRLIPDSSSSSSNNNSSIESIQNNPLLRYLQLRAIEAKTLNIPYLSKISVEFQGLTQGPDDETMRGIEPLSCDTVRKYWHACRFRIAAWSAFACPNNEATSAMKLFSSSNRVSCGVLEMGAGVGYWAMMLRDAGVDVLSYDKTPTAEEDKSQVNRQGNNGSSSNNNNNNNNYNSNSNRSSKNSGKKGKKGSDSNEYHGRFPSWSQVLHGDAASTYSTDRMLFMCYPPPNDPMATRALTGFSGSKFACVGEILGDTGTLDFDSRLRAGWDLRKVVSLPNFGNTCYNLTLWERKKVGVNVLGEGSTMWPMKCAACGVYPATDRKNDEDKKDRNGSAANRQDGQAAQGGQIGQGGQNKSPSNIFYRDRLTRAVWACSVECSRAEPCREALREAMRVRHIGYDFTPTSTSSSSSSATRLNSNSSAGGRSDDDHGDNDDGDVDDSYDMLWKRVTL